MIKYHGESFSNTQKTFKIIGKKGVKTSQKKRIDKKGPKKQAKTQSKKRSKETFKKYIQQKKKSPKKLY